MRPQSGPATGNLRADSGSQGPQSKFQARDVELGRAVTNGNSLGRGEPGHQDQVPNLRAGQTKEAEVLGAIDHWPRAGQAIVKENLCRSAPAG